MPAALVETGFITGRLDGPRLAKPDHRRKLAFAIAKGILNYLKENPDGSYNGECFVFDDRVAVDSNLMPSEQFKLCAKCGVPGDVQINCHCCDAEAVICKDCMASIQYPACSKDCEELIRRGVSRK